MSVPIPSSTESRRQRERGREIVEREKVLPPSFCDAVRRSNKASENAKRRERQKERERERERERETQMQ
jgi:hypothetical protein